MKKLFKYKEWLLLEEAAGYLTIMFGESVTKADVLRLGLDGHLKLSVFLVNHAQARRGVRLPIEEAEKIVVPGLGNDGQEVEIMCGLRLYDLETREIKEVVQFSEEEVTTIGGVWDLTMLGGERLDIEHAYQMEIDGAAVTLINIDGSYIASPNGEIFELLSRFDDGDIKKRSEGKPASFNDPDNFYPAGGLPDDSIVVIRTSALADFESSLNETKTAPAKSQSINPRTENNYLRLILQLANSNIKNFNPQKPYEAAKLIIENTHLNISEQTIADYITKASVLESKERD